MTIRLPDGITIRNSHPGDIDSFRDLRLESLKNHPDAFGQAYEDASVKGREYWESSLKVDANERALFFAVQDASLIGMTGIYRNQSAKTKHAASIWGVYVRPEWRGKRISEALVHACLDWAKIHDILIVKLAVVTGNLPALRSYERCGFSIYGTEPKAIQHGGRFYDEHLMAVEFKK
jgi:RimJ/RimL family protein N-acetyltransferase